MALFKCKMCGGDLEIREGALIAECEYCGTKQTVPGAIDENLQGLFNRANTLRIKNEFDKAEKLYEKIVQADPSQAEAYWGLILCKYGIEYVDDPVSFKKVPTCHRASFESIVADDDYRSAIDKADSSQRAIYEEQAKEIDRIQRDILTIARQEEGYDVFICYKETDDSGQRTHDSVIANDIYYQLTQEGFKVFYAAITLEGKLGSAYEPIIFAALNSAKAMLVIGTKPEYFNAVWVKNEWSRYLKIIKNDRTKLLIPCYRDMDAYELPEEFAHLQAQDMSKVGFISDIVRGIKKVINRSAPEAVAANEPVYAAAGVAGNANISTMLKRAFMFLEDGDWRSADEYCEKVLDLDPENPTAYLGKLMAELKVATEEQLKDQPLPFDNNVNYQKVLRFGDDALKARLSECTSYIVNRNEQAALMEKYQKAKTMMSTTNSDGKYRDLAAIFDTLNGFEDSAQLADECRRRATIIRDNKAREAEALKKEEQRSRTIRLIFGLAAGAIIMFLIFFFSFKTPAQYSRANALMEKGEYEKAYNKFIDLGNYRDSKEKAAEAKYALAEAKKAAIRERLSSCSVGDTIEYGSYEKKALHWRVLDISDGKALLLCEDIVDNVDFDSSWAQNNARVWLNGSFIKKAFDTAESANISSTNNLSNISRYTTDLAFLLSASEFNKYLTKDTASFGESWWLRDGNYAYVDGNGELHTGSSPKKSLGIRPAIWVYIS